MASAPRRSSGVAKPLAELKDVKDAPKTKDLKLAGKGIIVLSGFEPFVGLETLDLSNNKLASLAGLEKNTNLRELDLSNNLIDNLESSSLPYLTKLEKLSMAENKLKSLDKTLPILSKLPQLTELNLSGNPLASEESYYRDQLLRRLENLSILDGRSTAEEREALLTKLPVEAPPEAKTEESVVEGGVDVGGSQAPANVGNEGNGRWQEEEEERGDQPIGAEEEGGDDEGGGKGAGRKTRHKKKLTAAEELSPEALADLERLKGIVREIRRQVKARRILMKHEFIDLDKRKEEVVPEADFIRILDVYGVLPKPKPKAVDQVQAEKGDIVASGNDVPILVAYYSTRAPERCKVLGRDKKALDPNQHFINYVHFCQDVEPKVGGRDADNEDRLMEEAWKRKAPAIGNCLARLRKDVQVIKVRMAREREEGWKALASAEMMRQRVDSSASTTSTATSIVMRRSTTLSSATKLGAWELVELKRLLMVRDVNKVGVLTREEVVAAILDMELRGRRLEGMHQQQQQAWNTSSTTASDGSNSNMSPDLQAALDSLDQKGEGKIAWKEFLSGVEQNQGAFARLRWVKLRGEEAMRYSKDLFRKAGVLQNSLSLGAIAGKEAKEIEAQIQMFTQLAVRLQFQSDEEKDDARARYLRRQNSEKQATGRRDIIKVIDYLGPHRRTSSSTSSLSQKSEPMKRSSSDAVDHSLPSSLSQKLERLKRSTSDTDGGSSSSSSSSRRGVAATELRNARERFGLEKAVSTKYAIKQSLAAGNRGPFASRTENI